MGNAGSSERRLYEQTLKSMLTVRGAKVRSSQVEQFLHFVQQTCPWFPDEGTVNETTWAQVGEKLRDRYTAEGPAKMTVFTFTLWALIRDVLDVQKEEVKVKKSIVDTLASAVEGYTSLLPKPSAPPAERDDEPLPSDNVRKLGEEARRTEREKEADDSEEEDDFPDPENCRMQGQVRQLSVLSAENKGLFEAAVSHPPPHAQLRGRVKKLGLRFLFGLCHFSLSKIFTVLVSVR